MVQVLHFTGREGNMFYIDICDDRPEIGGELEKILFYAEGI
ncbi:MAG: hypothetical protein Q4D16_10320 [Eubacteriales bacterium]|nr:hypothetical protein [Eubacteriales bacterium]